MNMFFSLADGEPKQLKVSLDGGKTTVWFNDTILGTINKLDELKAGREFLLPDGSLLKVELRLGAWLVYKDGILIPAITKRLNQNVFFGNINIFLIGALDLWLGFILFRSPDHSQIGVGSLEIFFGLIFLVLCFFVWRKSLIAILVAIGLYSIDSISYLVSTILKGGQFNYFSFVRLIFLIGMISIVGAIRILREKRSKKLAT